MMLENLNDQAKGYEEIYKLHIRIPWNRRSFQSCRIWNEV